MLMPRNPQVLGRLIASRAQVDVADDEGKMPLDRATDVADEASVKLLEVVGASIR